MIESPIQQQILRRAIESPIFSNEVLARTPLTVFDGNDTYKEISNIVKRHYQTNTSVLSEGTLLTLAEDKLDRMRKDAETQQKFFNAIHELYNVADASNDNIIDEKIEKHIRKHMMLDLLKKAAVNLENSEMLEKVSEEWREIMIFDISGKQQEIINVIDDTEYKRRALSTLNINTLPTGFSSIDYLNGGGLAKGELGMIIAVSGTGKCVTGDTLIVTEKGLVEIQDIPNHFHVDAVTNESTAKVASYYQDGQYEAKHTSHWYNLGKSETVRVTTKSGYSIEGTPEHPLLVMSPSGDLEYVELQHMKKGDYLSLAKTNMWPTVDKISEEEAYMLGLLVADGYLAQDSGLISFSNSEELLIDYYKKQADELWGIKHMYSKRSKTSRTYDHSFSNVKLKAELNAKGLKMVKSTGKEIPYTVLQSSKQVARRFIQAMFDTEGSVGSRSIELTTASKRLAEQLQVLLLNFGIRASLKLKRVKGYEQSYYRLSISGLALRVFYHDIGFRFTTKYQLRLKEVIEHPTNTNVEVFPYQQARLKRIRSNHLRGLDAWDSHSQILDGKRLSTLFHDTYRPSRQTLDYILSYVTTEDEDTCFLRNITENMIFEPVETIEKSEAVVYDFTVPDTHSFVANGIISHNTLMLTNLATNYVKLKKNVLFIALEELENRMILKFEQAMLQRTKSEILTGSALNETNFNRYQEFYKKKRDMFGNLLFARYSPRKITPAKVEQLISDVKLRMGITVDVVIVDYPDLLRNPNATGNEAEDGGKLMEEMRRIGQDYNVVMWTASQMNRSAYSAEIRTSEHMEGSLRKRNAAELVLAVNQTPEEFKAGYVRLYADKLRNPPEGAFDKMLGFKVIGAAQTVREYLNDAEKQEHQYALEAASDRIDAMFKGKRKHKEKTDMPDYGAEINAALQQNKGA
jgi:intein/homing endonuclease